MDEKTNNIPGNFKVTGDWEAQSKALKLRFNLLTDSDLRFEAGRDHEILDSVQRRLSKNREEAIRIIRSVGNESLRLRNKENFKSK